MSGMGMLGGNSLGGGGVDPPCVDIVCSVAGRAQLKARLRKEKGERKEADHVPITVMFKDQVDGRSDRRFGTQPVQTLGPCPSPRAARKILRFTPGSFLEYVFRLKPNFIIFRSISGPAQKLLYCRWRTAALSP
jgi:hypothetical protein